MNVKYKQCGSTLITALIMLIVLTLLVISAIRSSNTNLRIAGNMQMQEEAVAAAQQGIENTISFNYFTAASAASAASSVNVDINNDGITDYTVNIAAPTCYSSKQYSSSTCSSSGAAQNAGIFYVSSPANSTNQAWCYEQEWVMSASAVGASTGATTTVHQGVSLTVPVGQPCPFTPE